jgi:hypothetical protein
MATARDPGNFGCEYAYVGCRPLSFADPYGLQAELTFIRHTDGSFYSNISPGGANGNSGPPKSQKLPTHLIRFGRVRIVDKDVLLDIVLPNEPTPGGGGGGGGGNEGPSSDNWRDIYESDPEEGPGPDSASPDLSKLSTARAGGFACGVGALFASFFAKLAAAVPGGQPAAAVLGGFSAAF